MIEIIVGVFLLAMSYYDLFNNENIPNSLIYTFFLISLVVCLSSLDFEKVYLAMLIFGVFFTISKFKQCGEAESWIFGSICLLYGGWIFLIIACSYVAITLKEFGEIKDFSLAGIRAEPNKSQAFIPFIFISFVSLILTTISI